MLSLPFLLERLEAPGEQIRMWAAYQLVDRHQSAAEQFIPHLWESPLPEIRESAVNLIGRYRLESHAFPLLRAFHANEGGQRAAAAIALGKLAYEPAGKAIRKWFARLMTTPDTNLNDLEAATEALLELDPLRHWDEVFGHLEAAQQNHAVFSLLFRHLCQSAATEGQIARLARVYRAPRELFHDHQLTQGFVELIGRPNLSRYFQIRLSAGYTLPAIYQEGFQVLGIGPLDAETDALLGELGRCINSTAGVRRFLPLGRDLVARLAPAGALSEAVLSFLGACESWVDAWEEAILKVRESEYHLLVSLPLVAVLNEVEAACLANPEGEAVRIARIYQSPLLSPAFMGQILGLLSHRGESGSMDALPAGAVSGWLRDEEKDALWKLLTGQLDGVDYPFEQVLPHPWEYPVPAVMPRLSDLLAKRFDAYLRDHREQAVDYCLAVFKRVGTPELVGLVLRHFEPLINRHYGPFVDLMTHLPDLRFLQLLLDYFRPDEYELAQLIRFVCDVHRIEPPSFLYAPEELQPGRQLSTTVRLHCPACGNAYQYAVGVLYVNEECIEQRQIPRSQDLWTAETLHCKNCKQAVPFEPGTAFLGDLYAELLAARLHPRSAGAEPLLSRVIPITFPTVAGQVLNPEAFLKEVERRMSGPNEPAARVPYLLELGRFYLDVGDLAAAKRVLHDIMASPVSTPMALYYLGVIAFQEKNLYEARVYFSRLIASWSPEDFEKALDNPVEMSQHYLKLLDKRDFKRSHFKLIST